MEEPRELLPVWGSWGGFGVLTDLGDGDYCRIKIEGGLEEFRRAVESVLRVVYEFNSNLKGLGVYLKPVHRVYRVEGGVRVVYEYYGRYWWRVERRGGRLRWRYIGRRPPLGAPEPPGHPLEGLSVKIVGDDVEMDCSWFEAFRRMGLLAGVRAVRIS